MLAEGRREGGVVLFEELGELLEGLAGLGNGGWAFKESQGFVSVPFLEEARYACNVLLVALSLLALYFFGGGWAGVFAWCPGVIGLVFH